MGKAKKSLLGLLSMAARARRIASGAFAVDAALKEKKAKLLIVAADASDETKEKYQEAAVKYNVPLKVTLTKDALGACLGKGVRAAAALTDEGFARKAQELLEEL